MPIQLNKFCPKKAFFLRITVLKLILLLSVPNWLNLPPNSLGHRKVSYSVGINFVFIALSPEHYAFLFNNLQQESQFFSGQDLVSKSQKQVEEANRGGQRGLEPTILLWDSTFSSKYRKPACSCCSCRSIRYRNMIIS